MAIVLFFLRRKLSHLHESNSFFTVTFWALAFSFWFLKLVTLPISSSFWTRLIFLLRQNHDRVWIPLAIAKLQLREWTTRPLFPKSSTPNTPRFYLFFTFPLCNCKHYIIQLNRFFVSFLNLDQGHVPSHTENFRCNMNIYEIMDKLHAQS